MQYTIKLDSLVLFFSIHLLQLNYKSVSINWEKQDLIRIILCSTQSTIVWSGLSRPKTLRLTDFLIEHSLEGVADINAHTTTSFHY